MAGSRPPGNLTLRLPTASELRYPSPIRTKGKTMLYRPHATKAPRPFLKWAGGKRSSLPFLLRAVPSSFRGYYEPFVGGAALFFALSSHRFLSDDHLYRLSDINTELMSTYVAVRDSVDAVIDALKPHKYDQEHYYRVRTLCPEDLSLPHRAARMIYLNRTGFNGLYRVNRAGLFNVPFGKYVNPVICDEANLRACAAVLARVDLVCAPFQSILEIAAQEDLVYFDPPYVPLSQTSSFVSYAQDGFGMLEQEELALVFDELNRRGSYVILSNSDTSWVRSRFQAYEIRAVEVNRRINSKGSARGAVGEVLVISDALTDALRRLSPTRHGASILHAMTGSE